MSYQIIFSELAERRFYDLSRDAQIQIAKRLSKAKEDPRPFTKGLTGVRHLVLRAGDYRVIIDLDDKNKVIMVLDMGHRREIYAGL
ncbi:MAG: type II toxin-antitoxin system RelE/ParE family toxin [Candidatus Micrarchaeota archaeon]|nr:type II toxin-antitoxin system RelE/ParE family toxin [Candidatus Micrarchaeota archaeon]